MVAAKLVVALLLVACGVSVKAEDLSVIDSKDPEFSQFSAIAGEFFGAVKAFDHGKIAALGSPEDAEHLNAALKDKDRPEYQRLYAIDGSPGAHFSHWNDFQWVAARDSELKSSGQGALLCLANRVDGGISWPPSPQDLRRLEREGTLVCVFTYQLESRRIVSFGFLYPED